MSQSDYMEESSLTTNKWCMRNDYLSHNSLRYFPWYITLRLYLHYLTQLS